ncbi:MAG TPA: TadE/TadG family type IV pilus assembly protein [Nocardioidaceae bacterium]|nr:TadE/TadG family type IV pilus assembly protein [Nocardioidaceae bacterium]
MGKTGWDEATGSHEPPRRGYNWEDTPVIMRARTHSGRQRAGQESGAAAVEFAIIMPILFSLVFGIIGFGMIFAQQLSLGNGARQGSRFGVVDGHSCQDVVDETQNASETVNMSASDVDVTMKLGTSESSASPICANAATMSTDEPCETSADGDNLYVYAAYESPVTVPLLPMKGPTFHLQSVGVFRCEFTTAS